MASKSSLTFTLFLSPSKSFITRLLLYSKYVLNGLPDLTFPFLHWFLQMTLKLMLWKKCFMWNSSPVQNPELPQNQVWILLSCSGHTWQIYFPTWHNMDLPLDGSVKRKMVWESGSTAFRPRDFHLLVWMSTRKWPYTNSLTSEPILNSHGQACCCMFFLSPLSAVITFYIITSLLLIDCPILYSIVLPKGTSSVLWSPLTSVPKFYNKYLLLREQFFFNHF